MTRSTWTQALSKFLANATSSTRSRHVFNNSFSAERIGNKVSYIELRCKCTTARVTFALSAWSHEKERERERAFFLLPPSYTQFLLLPRRLRHRASFTSLPFLLPVSHLFVVSVLLVVSFRPSASLCDSRYPSPGLCYVFMCIFAYLSRNSSAVSALGCSRLVPCTIP